MWRLAAIARVRRSREEWGSEKEGGEKREGHTDSRSLPLWMAIRAAAHCTWQ